MSNQLKSILKEPEIGSYEHNTVLCRPTKAEHLFDNIIGNRIYGNNNYSKNSRRQALQTIVHNNLENSSHTSSLTSNQTSSLISNQTSSLTSNQTSSLISNQTSSLISNQTSSLTSNQTSSLISNQTSSLISNQTSRQTLSQTSQKPISKTGKSKNRVKFSENSVKKKSGKTRQMSSRAYPDCTKQSLLKAFASANLPDYDEIARYELHVTKADNKYFDKPDLPIPPLYQILKPFEDLIDWKKQNLSNDDSLSTDRKSVPKPSDTSCEWQTSNTDLSVASDEHSSDSLNNTIISKVNEVCPQSTSHPTKFGSLLPHKKLFASTPISRRINFTHNQTENLSPIESFDDTLTNNTNVTKMQHTFTAPQPSKSRQLRTKVSISKNAIPIHSVIPSATSFEKVKVTTNIDKMPNDICNVEKIITKDNSDSLINGDSRKNNSSDHTSHAFQESECESTIKNVDHSFHSLDSINVGKDISNFAPKVKSTPLYNSRRKCASDKFSSLKSLKSSSRFDLIVDKSLLDSSVFKLFTQTSKENSRRLGQPLTTTCIPVLDTSDRRNDTMNASKSKKSKLSSAYQIYRKSIAAAHSIYNKTGLPCRTVVRSLTPVSSDNNVCIASNLSNKDELKPYVDKSMISLSLSKVVYDNGNEEFLAAKEKVLLMCEPNYIIKFNNAFERKILNNIKKIGEGSYGEVYISKDECDNDVVIKIIPINMCVDSDDDIFSQILPELVITATINCLQNGVSNKAPNFIHLIKASCAMGLFPDKLIREWDDYASRKQSENEDPRNYKKNQLYIILHLANGGTDLESYKFKSAIQAFSIFLQLTFAIASSECEYQFEHRDLHWGNVLINGIQQSNLNYIVNRKHYTFQTHSIFASIIDFSLSRMSNEGFTIYDDLSKYPELFEGIGDYQFEIYRKMKEHNNNDWQQFCPHTNILWLHYLLDKLLISKKYSSRSKNHKTAFNILSDLSKNVLNYRSATDFVESDRMKAYLKQFNDFN